ncbi:MAG: hypothetical protein VXX55_14655, partial [Planctomycetota bacterium]|nr:hypothetical protein [Planctomycetota bacterium]
INWAKNQRQAFSEVFTLNCHLIEFQIAQRTPMVGLSQSDQADRCPACLPRLDGITKPSFVGRLGAKSQRRR